MSDKPKVVFSEHVAVRLTSDVLARVDAVRVKLVHPCGNEIKRSDALRFLVETALKAIDEGLVNPADAKPHDVRGKRGRARLHG